MKKAFRIGAILFSLIFLCAQFVRPAKTNPPSDPAQSIFARLEIPPTVTTQLKHSCGDCHSNNTRWLWYSEVAPVSWWTIDHVNQGRSHLNFSEWGKLPPQDAAKVLSEICEEIESGGMPLPSYLWMHGNAKLSMEDRKAICTWTVEQRNKLAGKAGEHSEHNHH